jgi:hypothetical protein
VGYHTKTAISVKPSQVNRVIATPRYSRRKSTVSLRPTACPRAQTCGENLAHAVYAARTAIRSERSRKQAESPVPQTILFREWQIVPQETGLVMGCTNKSEVMITVTNPFHVESSEQPGVAAAAADALIYP